MKNAKIRALAIAAVALTNAAAAHAAPAGVAGGANAFGIDLLGKLVKAKAGGNCFISPYSIQQALLLADNGAGGSTKTQIETVLHIGGASLGSINAQAKALRESLTSADPKVKLAVANAIWADPSVQFASSYQETCRKFYAAIARTVPLATPAGSAAINGWVADKTLGHIKTIVPVGGVPNSVAVLTNALYFHGDWATPFKAFDTRPRPFHVTSQTTKQTPTMSRTDVIDYAKTGGEEAVALPYGGGRLRMIAVLPAEGVDLNAFIASLTPAKWTSLAQKLKPTRLSLYLPRVHAEYSDSLKPALKSLGMTTAFSNHGANFRAVGLGNIYVSDVIHKTTLDIDEQGATATAATGVVMAPMAAILPPSIQVHIDRPFFCAIQDTKTGLVLFAGAIRNPS